MNDWEEIGIVKCGLDMHSEPTVMRISQSKHGGDLSYEFGVMRGGRIDLVRFWHENRLFSLATLTKAAAAMSLSQLLTHGERALTPAALERAVAQSGGLLVLVEDGMLTYKQQQQRQETKGRSLGKLGDLMKGREKR